MNTAVYLPKDPEITPEVIADHGITPEEYDRIVKILKREPNYTELGIFSVMWSEHCSYKNSRPELKKFPVTGPTVLVKAGEENAGVIDIGDGWAIAFKMESHNHPSAIEPFQGAATGVGGIIRDIFTMGARPVFGLNSLRFGPISGTDEHGETPANVRHNRRLFRGVVEGIAHYGNCIGVPTIGGEVYFDETYEGNPLVNVFCLGILKHEQIARGAASGIGNPVFYVGAETGRDGLAGAAFASRELTEESKEDRPAVQVGDPFKEKLLLEACLELLTTDAVAGIQDMGAAGLTCSTCETASRGGTGVEIDLEKVPKREPGMTPYEILLSESQERMLIIVHKGKEDVVRAIFEKWDLPHAEVGVVKDDGLMRVKVGDVTVAEIPARDLADEAPVYHREVTPQSAPAPLTLIPSDDLEGALSRLLADPTLASKEWIYRQFDHMVRIGTTVLPGSDAAVFIVREADKILAATSDCNATYCVLDPREGARAAIAEAARNLACSGAVPLAVTDNLNFGNPHKPENFWQLREAVEGLAEGCRAFEIPVTGGNVSLYNESPAGAIDPTPTVGMVGLIEDQAHVTQSFFRRPGDAIVLLGELGDKMGMGGSQYLKVLYGLKQGVPPRVDFEKERALHDTLRELIRSGLVESAHDCAEGGLAVTLAESAIGGKAPIGAKIDFGVTGLVPEVLLFNEAQARVVISTRDADAVLRLAAERDIPARTIGTTTSGDALEITADGRAFKWKVAELHRTWSCSLGNQMSA